MGPRASLDAQLAERLKGLPAGVSQYDNDLPDTPPIIPGDKAGRVRPYLVRWTGSGAPDVEETLEGTDYGIDWTFGITCVAGRTGDLLQLVDDTTALLERWRPVIEGQSTGLCRQINDPGLPRPDRSVTPTRYVLPLQYRVTAGT